MATDRRRGSLPSPPLCDQEPLILKAKSPHKYLSKQEWLEQLLWKDLEIFQETMLKTNLSRKPSWRAQIADTYTLIAECGRALSEAAGKRPRRRASHQISFSLHCHFGKLNRSPCKQNGSVCVLQGLHCSILKTQEQPNHDKKKCDNSESEGQIYGVYP